MEKRKGNGRRRIFIFIGLFIVVGVCVFVASTIRPPTGAPGAGGPPAGGPFAARNTQPKFSDPVMIATGDLLVTVTATGNVVAAQTSNLTFDTAGIVQTVLVTEGQQVKQGDTLATLEDSNQLASIEQAELSLKASQLALEKVLEPVDPNDIASAEASLKSAEGSLRAKLTSVTQGTIDTYQARLEQARANQEYALKLLNDAGGKYALDDASYQKALAQKGEADFNYEIARLNLQSAKKIDSVAGARASVAYYKAKLAQVKAGPKQSTIDQAQVNVLSSQNQLDVAKRNLTKTRLIAPYTGTITQVNVKVGEPNAGTAMVLADIQTRYVDIDVDETDIGKVEIGQKVTLTFDALTKVTVTGTVQRIKPIADSSASVITYPVRIVLDKTDAPIRVGMTTNATFNVREVKNVVLVPNQYLKVNRSAGQVQVMVNLVNADGKTFTVLPVKLGVEGADYTEVLEGLSAGDKIALVNQATKQ